MCVQWWITLTLCAAAFDQLCVCVGGVANATIRVQIIIESKFINNNGKIDGEQKNELALVYSTE